MKPFSITVLIIFYSLFCLLVLAQESLRTVIAKQGDTVTTIAQRYNVDPIETAKLNGLLTSTKLPAGRKIKIPEKINTLPKIDSTQSCFSNSELNLNIEQLPKSYHGHNLALIIEELARRKSIQKDEFETTKQFQERIQAENNKPVLGNLTLASNFAFQGDSNFTYDADREEMTASLSLSRGGFWNNVCDNTIKRKYGLEFKEFENIEDSYKAKDLWSSNFKVDIPTAKKIKPSLGLLLIAQIANVSQKYLGRDSYNDSYLFRRFLDGVLYVTLKEIWVYDIETGRIWIKDKIESKKLIEETKNPKVRENLDKARSLYNSQNNDEALNVLRLILASEPMAAEAYLIIGKIHYRRGDIDQAISSMKTALFWDNRLIEAHIVLGNIYLKKGDCLQSQNYSRLAMEIDPENQEAKSLAKQVERCS